MAWLRGCHRLTALDLFFRELRLAEQGLKPRFAWPPRSAYGGFLSGMAAIAPYWLAFGGLDAAKPEAVTNDLHDLEYGILGALSHSL